MASAMPDLQLPSQLPFDQYQIILLGEQRHRCVMQLAQEKKYYLKKLLTYQN